MRSADAYNLEILARSSPYIVVKHQEDTFTILDEGLDFPFDPAQNGEEQWLEWLVEFSVSINGITASILQKHVDERDRVSAFTNFTTGSAPWIL